MCDKKLLQQLRYDPGACNFMSAKYNEENELLYLQCLDDDNTIISGVVFDLKSGERLYTHGNENIPSSEMEFDYSVVLNACEMESVYSLDDLFSFSEHSSEVPENFFLKVDFETISHDSLDFDHPPVFLKDTSVNPP
ncbi:hypothetical protein RF11_00356 [Thelohanellus kitauei]|uniref:Uncharacterized protein n=1 Tax=Thelohanellus kitauei TaxID=669202 RepID=A0A0C2IIR4_THEKT|nr:hypothetical protein RF11_00356 [Thelohanellus kitauei]